MTEFSRPVFLSAEARAGLIRSAASWLAQGQPVRVVYDRRLYGDSLEGRFGWVSRVFTSSFEDHCCVTVPPKGRARRSVVRMFRLDQIEPVEEFPVDHPDFFACERRPGIYDVVDRRGRKVSVLERRGPGWIIGDSSNGRTYRTRREALDALGETNTTI